MSRFYDAVSHVGFYSTSLRCLFHGVEKQFNRCFKKSWPGNTTPPQLLKIKCDKKNLYSDQYFYTCKFDDVQSF